MREQGKAKRADLSGHFAGEQHDAVAPLARFLVNARQISEIEEGRALGNDGTVAIPARSQDTEAYPPLLQRAEGNGHNGNGHNGNGHAGNNGHSGNGAMPTASLAPDAMEPQPEADLFGDPVAGEPQLGTETAMDMAPVSSGDTVHDTALAPEPEPATAQPELSVSPEPEMQPLSLDATESGMSMDMSASDTAFDSRLEPEAAPDTVFEPPAAAKPKPDTEIKTRVMTPRDIKARAQDLSPEELKIETGTLSKLNPESDFNSDDEETSASKKGDEPEKITTKVEQKTAPQAQPGTVVRDTVNFYNQTMALRDLLESNQRPAPNVPLIATQKLPSPHDDPSAPISTHKIPPPREMPKPRPKSAPSLAPAAPELQSEPEAEPESRDEQTRAFMMADIAPADAEAPGHAGSSPDLAAEPDADSTATREVKALPVEPKLEAPSLDASEDHEEADRKDTDRFNLADLRPADLPPPEGTDKIDKRALPENEDEPLRVSDEDTASHRDTQRFFVSDLVGVATFKPAPKPVPLSDDAEQGDLTSSGSTTGMGAPAQVTPRAQTPRVDTRNLPAAAEVESDFTPPPKTSGTRIVPEFVPGQPKAVRPGSGRLRSADTESAEKITEKVKQAAAAPSADTDRVPAPDEDAPPESPVKKITDALTRRLRQERDETRKLIEEAEGVLLRLRQTPVSARQPKVAVAQQAAAHVDDSEPQPSAEPEEAFAALPPLEDIASATIHDLRLAEEILQASKTVSAAEHKTASGRQPAVLGAPAQVQPSLSEIAASRGARSASGRSQAIPDDSLLRIEQRLGGAAHSLDEILTSTSAALAKVTGELTREEFEERKRQRESQRRPISLRKALSGSNSMPDVEEADPYEDMSLNELVSASTRNESASQSRRTPSGRRILEDEQVSWRTSTRPVGNSLSDDLSKLLSEAAKSTRIHNAPKADNIPAKEPGLEFTEGPLWQSLLGIAGVTAFLAALFIWVWFMIASRGA
jgi:hypothetical protein